MLTSHNSPVTTPGKPKVLRDDVHSSGLAFSIHIQGHSRTTSQHTYLCAICSLVLVKSRLYKYANINSFWKIKANISIESNFAHLFDIAIPLTDLRLNRLLSVFIGLHWLWTVNCHVAVVCLLRKGIHEIFILI